VHRALEEQSEDRGADVSAAPAAPASASTPATWSESATAGKTAGSREAGHRRERRAAVGELPEVFVRRLFVVMPVHLDLLSSNY
jgi:hypothetical protein